MNDAKVNRDAKRSMLVVMLLLISHMSMIGVSAILLSPDAVHNDVDETTLWYDDLSNYNHSDYPELMYLMEPSQYMIDTGSNTDRLETEFAYGATEFQVNITLYSNVPRFIQWTFNSQFDDDVSPMLYVDGEYTNWVYLDDDVGVVNASIMVFLDEPETDWGDSYFFNFIFWDQLEGAIQHFRVVASMED